MKRGFLWVLIVCLFACPVLSQAASVDTYQVEIVIFSQISPENLALEHWRAFPPIEIPKNALELDPEQLLPPSRWRLKNIQQTLQSNHNPVLLHIAWQEKADGLKTKRIFHLIGGEEYTNQLPQMNGIMVIQLQHYFDTYFNLQFLRPTDATNTALFRYNLSQKLRLRSNELNYIDYPLYGIFIEIFQVPAQI